MKFSAHGKYSFKVGRNYILANTQGGFNEEGVHSLFSDTLQHASKHDFKQWVYIEVIDKDAFITPEAVEVLFSKYAVLKDKGCRLVMTVCGNWMQKEVSERLKKSVPLPVQSFETETEALKFAEQF
jgi:thiazole synthase ThiGH ThiG subunit